MKPLKLAVAGLHSFREKQIIDFETLCEGGVFGIFGPTGSGKSSILDAMTLALYGKVERASNNTQGILNHAENELSVSFLFALENGESQKKYQVERSFKRSDEWRVRSATSRLIDMSEEPTVLADKTSDVNQAIQNLLGLTIEDFTKAVVLPQGKFAEFLALKGTDRRQMLQRLFNLEQYGDELTKKIKEGLAKIKAEISNVDHELIGLGDASDEAVKAAMKKVEECNVLLQKRKKELEQLEKQFTEHKQLWEWQQEQTTVGERLSSLKQEEPAHKALEEKLRRAEKAERLLPYLHEYQEARKLLLKVTEQREELEKQLSHKQVIYEKAESKYEQAKKEHDNTQPILLAKRENLQYALDLKKELQEKEYKIKSVESNKSTLEQQYNKQQTDLQQAESDLAKGNDLQQKLKLQTEQYIITPEYRAKVLKANDDFQQILGIRRQVNEWQLRVDGNRNKLQDVESKLKTIHGTYAQVKQVLHNAFEKANNIYENCSKAAYQCEAFVAFLDRKQKALVAAEREQLAYHLARQLQAGEQCPVCGSCEHPHPAAHNDAHVTADELHKWQELYEEARQELSLYPQLKWRLEQLAEKLVPKLEVAAGLSRYEADEDYFSTDMIINEAHDVFKAIATTRKGNQQDVLELTQVVQVNVEKAQVMHEQKQDLEKTHSLYSESLEVEEKKWEALRQELAEKENAWKNTYQFEKDIEQIKRDIAYKDEQTDVLTKRIQKGTTFIETCQKSIHELQEKTRQTHSKLVEVNTTYQHMLETVEQTRAKLYSIIGNSDAEELYKNINNQLSALSAQVKEAYEVWRSEEAALQELKSSLHAATKSLEQSTHRFTQAESKWNSLIRETIFDSIEDVLVSTLDEANQQKLQETIQLFWDKLKQLERDWQALQNKLAGREITEEAWKNTQQHVTEMKESFNTIMEERGALIKEHESLLERKARYDALMMARTELETEEARYSKLQAVFRGNSFIEFIAEEQLMHVTRAASQRLAALTRGRYAIEVDSEGGFIMRDDANGGVRRPVTTLSGGETFLTSLALALALSAQIQLKGVYPLQFFFLDEGFGTLDAELLDTVVSALEKLQTSSLSVGVISHVQELRARLPRKLIVERAEPSGRGTRVSLEEL
ncbi:SMC family ATPase [Bacillus sp. HMF5848]|uniref:AAA family ATPase n=1 Tax=Bacillus sp. HMF5848 TaxID=2495421 RepID=UPI000F766A27|nr:SMC family ATPase [Bacillus sp. HMF5848]RSK26358.1 SMC family ATPase [Bacillus sp. HMF5848]